MTSTARLLILILLLSASAAAQTPAVENSIFWEIRGKDLTQPSYLFGTYHLLGSHYADSLTNVMSRFYTCRTMVGEIVYDSTVMPHLLQAARMNGTTLDKLLSPTIYNQTANWLKELSGYELKYLDTFNPMTVQLLLMTALQQKYYPMNATTEVPLDLYFQNLAKQSQRPIAGLESFDDQVKALYNQFTYERQAELLTSYVLEKDKAAREIMTLLNLYRQQKLDQLEHALDTQDYSETEIQVLTSDRNKKWIAVLPALLRDGPTFIAVGALHLPGENGLINLLRKAGYTVNPLPLR